MTLYYVATMCFYVERFVLATTAHPPTEHTTNIAAIVTACVIVFGLVVTGAIYLVYRKYCAEGELLKIFS